MAGYRDRVCPFQPQSHRYCDKIVGNFRPQAEALFSSYHITPKSTQRLSQTVTQSHILLKFSMKNSRIAIDNGVTSSLEGNMSQFRGNGELVTQEVDAPETAIPIHPLGIKPSGNAYMAFSNARDTVGPFQILPDEIIAILLEYFQPSLLLKLGATCKFFYAFSRSEELWKALFIEYVLLYCPSITPLFPTCSPQVFDRQSRDLHKRPT